MTALRTHTSAAPLKPDLPMGGDRETEALRTHTSAAPLKHERRGLSGHVVQHSPHSHECGSVEAVFVVVARLRMQRLSALTRVRLR